MKQGNRYGDVRVNILRVGDSILMGGKFFKILNAFQTPGFVVDLSVAGAKLVGAISDGQLAAGTLAVPTAGVRTEVEEIVPLDDLRLVMTYVGVEKFKVQGAVGDAEMKELSCRVRYSNPREVPRWLTPDGEQFADIDGHISPWNDPNELFPIFVKRDETPNFQAFNVTDQALPCAINLGPLINYVLEELAEKPAAFREIPTSQQAGFGKTAPVCF